MSFSWCLVWKCPQTFWIPLLEEMRNQIFRLQNGTNGSWIQSFARSFFQSDEIPLVSSKEQPHPQHCHNRQVVYASSAIFSIEINTSSEISINVSSLFCVFHFSQFDRRSCQTFWRGCGSPAVATEPKLEVFNLLLASPPRGHATMQREWRILGSPGMKRRHKWCQTMVQLHEKRCLCGHSYPPIEAQCWNLVLFSRCL